MGENLALRAAYNTLIDANAQPRGASECGLKSLLALVDSSITLAAGAFFTLLAYRAIGARPTDETFHLPDRFDTLRRIGRVAGPVLLLFGVVNFGVDLSRISADAPVPVALETPDGVAQIEFPGKPEVSESTSLDVVSTRWTFDDERARLQMSLSWYRASADAQEFSERKALDSMLAFLLTPGDEASTSRRLLRDEEILVSGCSAREILIGDGSERLTARAAFVDGGVYLASVAAPSEAALRTKAADRFIRSFQLRAPPR